MAVKSVSNTLRLINECITSNDDPFGGPIISTDIFSLIGTPYLAIISTNKPLIYIAVGLITQSPLPMFTSTAFEFFLFWILFNLLDNKKI